MEQQRLADIWLRRLLQAGIANFLLISAFDIHAWRVEHWRSFEAGFNELAMNVFGQTPDGWWLYAVAFPVVAVNFGTMVAMLMGKRGLLWPFALSAIGIAAMEMVGWQTAVYRIFWADLLTQLGYATGGAIAAILFFRLDTQSQAHYEARQKE